MISEPKPHCRGIKNQAPPFLVMNQIFQRCITSVLNWKRIKRKPKEGFNRDESNG